MSVGKQMIPSQIKGAVAISIFEFFADVEKIPTKITGNIKAVVGI